MLRSALVALAVAAGNLPALAGAVDPEIHRLCIEAKDYAGCVKAMKGETSGASSEPVTRTIHQRGADIEEGNSCPSGMAYRGGGNCQQVICVGRGQWFVGRHHQELGGKYWECTGGGIGSGGRLDYGNQTGRAYYDRACPQGSPQIGYRSTCESNAGGGSGASLPWENMDPYVQIED